MSGYLRQRAAGVRAAGLLLAGMAALLLAGAVGCGRDADDTAPPADGTPASPRSGEGGDSGVIP